MEEIAFIPFKVIETSRMRVTCQDGDYQGRFDLPVGVFGDQLEAFHAKLHELADSWSLDVGEGGVLFTTTMSIDDLMPLIDLHFQEA